MSYGSTGHHAQPAIVAGLVGWQWAHQRRTGSGPLVPSAFPECFSRAFLHNRRSRGAHDATDTHLKEVYPNQNHEDEWQEYDVKAIHLPEVQQVEEGTDANRVERIFALGGDPLR